MKNEIVIYKILKDICDIFKNKFNFKINYIEYLSALLYLKYYDYDSFRTILEKKNQMNIFEACDIWLKTVLNEMHNRYLFSNITFTDLNGNNMYSFLDILDQLNVIESMVGLNFVDAKKFVAKAYAFILEDLTKKGELIRSHEEFYTPDSITDLVSNMLELKNKDVLDPCSGSGNFLISAYQVGANRIFGKENNVSKYNICLTNLFLNSIDIEHIEFDDGNMISNDMKYDRIVSNPPFSRRNSFDDISDRSFLYQNYLIRNNYADYVYVLKMFAQLKQNGKMAVLLPHGALFRKDEIDVRTKLIRENYIDAIIGLPEKLFYANKISVVIMVLSKDKKDHNILYIDASKKYITNKSNHIIPKTMQDEIVDAYHFRKEIDGFSKIVTSEEIEKNDYVLAINRYVKENIERQDIDYKQIIEEIHLLEKQYHHVEKTIQTILEHL